MNYEIHSDDNSPGLMRKFQNEPEFRLHVNHNITIKGFSGLFRVTRTEPTDNPDDVMVKYFVRPSSEFPEPNAFNAEISQSL